MPSETDFSTMKKQGLNVLMVIGAVLFLFSLLLGAWFSFELPEPKFIFYIALVGAIIFFLGLIFDN